MYKTMNLQNDWKFEVSLQTSSCCLPFGIGLMRKSKHGQTMLHLSFLCFSIAIFKEYN